MSGSTSEQNDYTDDCGVIIPPLLPEPCDTLLIHTSGTTTLFVEEGTNSFERDVPGEKQHSNPAEVSTTGPSPSRSPVDEEGHTDNTTRTMIANKVEEDGDQLSDILHKASTSWLPIEDIINLLTPGALSPSLPISADPPTERPSSGSLYLYDRSQTRFFRHDHVEWVKERSGRKTREDHVKLRLRGKIRVQGCYAHGKNSGLRRRAYNLFKEVAAPSSRSDSDDGGGGSTTSKKKTAAIPQDHWENSLILVHYLDVSKKDECPSPGGAVTAAATRDSIPSAISGDGTGGKRQRNPEPPPNLPPTMVPWVPAITQPLAPTAEVPANGGNVPMVGEWNLTQQITSTLLSSTNDVGGVGQGEVRPAHGRREDVPAVLEHYGSDRRLSIQPEKLLPEIVDFNPESAPVRRGGWGVKEQGGLASTSTNVLLATSSPLPYCCVYDDSPHEDELVLYAAFVDLELVEYREDDDVDVARDADDTANEYDGARVSSPSSSTTTTKLEVQRVDVFPLDRRSPTAFRCEIVVKEGSDLSYSPGYRTVVLVGIPQRTLTHGSRRGSTVTLEEAVTNTLQESCDSALDEMALLSSSVDEGVRPTFFSSTSTARPTEGDDPTVHVLSQLSMAFFEFTLPLPSQQPPLHHPHPPITDGSPSELFQLQQELQSTTLQELHPSTSMDTEHIDELTRLAIASETLEEEDQQQQDTEAQQYAERIPSLSERLEGVPTLAEQFANHSMMQGEETEKGGQYGDGSSGPIPKPIVPSSWIDAPRFDERDGQKERETMTFDELASALSDVHGTVDPSLRRFSTVGNVSDGDVQKLEEALQSIPDRQKEAYMTAVKLCPEEVGHREKCLFLLTNESHDPKMSAKRLCQHWALRLEIFGEDKAFLPMTLSGALKDDWAMLAEIDFMHPLPGVTDQCGRSIMFAHGYRFVPSVHDHRSLFRSMWYMLHTAALIAQYPSEGYVMIRSAATIDISNMHIFVLNQWLRIMVVMPTNIRALHLVNAGWWEHLVRPVITKTMGRRLRQRVCFHRGSDAEIISRLSSYGIGRGQIPAELGGDYRIDLVQWLESRKERGL